MKRYKVVQDDIGSIIRYNKVQDNTREGDKRVREVVNSNGLRTETPLESAGLSSDLVIPS